MAKAVFAWKEGSDYDDEPGVRYNFPSRYLADAKQTVGDWILFHELSDRNRGRAAYVSIAKVREILPDPARPKHYYAYLSDAADLAQPVPVDDGGAFLESALRPGPGQKRSMRIRDAIRLLPEHEFFRIVARGSADLAGDGETAAPAGLAEDAAPYGRERALQNRAVRDAMFRTRVLRAYDRRCALTGLRLLNGGGAAEVEAAHIKAVADGGPDLVTNGLALTRSVHWMFDRHLISFDGDLNLIRTAMLDPDAHRFLGNVSALEPPRHHLDRPNPVFLKHHRDRTMEKERAYLGR